MALRSLQIVFGGIEGSLDFRVQLVNRHPRIVERGCLEDNAAGPRHAGDGKHPQEEAIQHHGYVLPILYHLYGKRREEQRVQSVKG